MSKVVFITGAAGGMGYALAENFVKQGARVVLVDQAGEKLVSLVENLHKKLGLADSRAIKSFSIDIAEPEQVQQAVQEVMTDYGRIDVLFNGAGIALIGGIEMSSHDFEKIIRVNLLGTFHCIHAIAPIMKHQGSGYIFNVASRLGKMGMPHLAGYASSKFGIMGLSESVLKELIDTGVKVTALCPSYTDTPMMDVLDFPREEMLAPDDIVKTVNYLLSLSAPACVREVLIEVRKLVL